MTDDLLNKFKRLHDLLGKLDRVLPDTGEPVDARLVWYSDGSSAIELEIWGVVVAQTFGEPAGKLIVAERYVEDKGLNLEFVKHVVGRMNEAIKLEDEG